MNHDIQSTDTPPVGLFGSVKNLAASLVSHLHTRLQLFATEFAEEKLRLTSLLFGAILALFFAFMTLVLAVLFVLAAYWDTPYRLHAVAFLTVLFLVGAGIAGGLVHMKLKSKPRLFEASLAELYKDRQQLNSP
ncbi:MAG: phage holin family protein [Sulfuricaulis sp.]|uniref:phage holin family protein n=1 Tax=Sulfuricaulis sp. TaxID=2003553 RepID=UPI0025F4B459|nr:phage holin family protein [Sulfuricaulis sp.]MCR4346429.1 phage holin family protein [Sulfuricaulis sp.]